MNRLKYEQIIDDIENISGDEKCIKVPIGLNEILDNNWLPVRIEMEGGYSEAVFDNISTKASLMDTVVWLIHSSLFKRFVAKYAELSFLDTKKVLVIFDKIVNHKMLSPEEYQIFNLIFDYSRAGVKIFSTELTKFIEWLFGGLKRLLNGMGYPIVLKRALEYMMLPEYVSPQAKDSSYAQYFVFEKSIGKITTMKEGKVLIYGDLSWKGNSVGFSSSTFDLGDVKCKLDVLDWPHYGKGKSETAFNDSKVKYALSLDASKLPDVNKLAYPFRDAVENIPFATVKHDTYSGFFMCSPMNFAQVNQLLQKLSWALNK